MTLTILPFGMGIKMQVKTKGFTLFELLVVVSIIGILSLMAAPIYSNLAVNQNLEESTTSLVSAINQARSKAIIEKRVIQVNLNSYAANTDTTLNWSPTGTSTLVRSTATTIFFGPNGFSQQSATNTDPTAELIFTICNGPLASATVSRQIAISYLGSISDSGLTGGCSAS